MTGCRAQRVGGDGGPGRRCGNGGGTPSPPACRTPSAVRVGQPPHQRAALNDHPRRCRAQFDPSVVQDPPRAVQPIKDGLATAQIPDIAVRRGRRVLHGMRESGAVRPRERAERRHLMLAEVAVYGTALSARQIGAHWSAGASPGGQSCQSAGFSPTSARSSATSLASSCRATTWRRRPATAPPGTPPATAATAPTTRATSLSSPGR